MTARVQCHACNQTPEACTRQHDTTGLACCTPCQLAYDDGHDLHLPDACHRHLEPGGACRVCGVVIPEAA